MVIRLPSAVIPTVWFSETTPCLLAAQVALLSRSGLKWQFDVI
jgi:hypothetical protein